MADTSSCESERFTGGRCRLVCDQRPIFQSYLVRLLHAFLESTSDSNWMVCDGGLGDNLRQKSHLEGGTSLVLRIVHGIVTRIASPHSCLNYLPLGTTARLK